MKGSLIIIAFFALGVACGLGRVFSIDLAQTDISESSSFISSSALSRYEEERFP